MSLKRSFETLYFTEFTDEVGNAVWRDLSDIFFGVDTVWARGYFPNPPPSPKVQPALVELNEALINHPNFKKVLQAFVSIGQTIVVIRTLAADNRLSYEELVALVFDHPDQTQKTSILKRIREKLDAFDTVSSPHVKHNIDAAVGAAHLFREIQFKLTAEQKNTVQLQELSLQAALVLRRVFLYFHVIGKASFFFELFGVRPDWENEPQPTILQPSELFRALTTATSSVEANSQKETQNPQPDILVATVGRNNSGKNLVTEHLKNCYGFSAEPLSHRVREYAAALGHSTGTIDRNVLITVGNRVRTLLGDAVLIRTAISALRKPGTTNKLLFDGLRSPGEASEILQMQNRQTQVVCFSVVSSLDPDEDLHIRFQRALKRGSSKDPKENTPEEFAKWRELDEMESAGIEAARQYATHTLVNQDGKQAETLAYIDTIMSDLQLKQV